MCFGNSNDDSPIPLSLSKLSEAVSVTPAAAVLGLVGLEANSVAKLSNRNLLAAAPFPDPDDTEMAESVEARFCVVEVSILLMCRRFHEKNDPCSINIFLLLMKLHLPPLGEESKDA